MPKQAERQQKAYSNFLLYISTRYSGQQYIIYHCIYTNRGEKITSAMQQIKCSSICVEVLKNILSPIVVKKVFIDICRKKVFVDICRKKVFVDQLLHSTQKNFGMTKKCSSIFVKKKCLSIYAEKSKKLQVLCSTLSARRYVQKC